MLQPGVMFISHAREHIIRDYVRGAPDMVIEVTSEGTARYDRTEKVDGAPSAANIRPTIS